MHLANTPVVSPESKKPKALTSGLNFFASKRLNGFPALERNLASFSEHCNCFILQNYIYWKYFSFCDF
jgi:hypothetical protein